MLFKQTQAQDVLSDFKITGQTASGQTQKLAAEVKKHPSKLRIEAEQEYVLINKLNEAGVEVKARFIEDEIPTDREKLLYMIGEACYAIALQYDQLNTELQEECIPSIDLASQNKTRYESFMHDLTETVKKYHGLT
jgi:hypothetical protein